MIIIYIFLFIILCLVLIKSTAWVSKSLVSLSSFFGWSKFFIGFVLMAFVTTLPEFIVGISSAVSRVPSLSLGNVLGSNIVNLTFILGLVAVLSGHVSVLRQISLRSASFLFFIALLPLLLIADMNLSRIDGIVLLLVFVAYLRFLAKQRKSADCAADENHKVLRAKRADSYSADLTDKTLSSLFKSIGLFVIGSLLLLASAWGITYSAIKIANAVNVPFFIIGLIGVALGTSLPELAFGIFSVWKNKENGLHIGNLLGSVAINSTWILGVTAVIMPIKIQANKSIWLVVIFTVLIIAFFNFFMRTKKKISWVEGLILIAFYILFIILQGIIR